MNIHDRTGIRNTQLLVQDLKKRAQTNFSIQDLHVVLNSSYYVTMAAKHPISKIYIYNACFLQACFLQA